MTTTTDSGAENPLVGFHFAIDIGGVIDGYFTECNGLGSETATIDHNVVNESGVEVVMKIPGRLKWGDITLKRGVTSNMDIWDWRKQVENGDVDSARRDGSIVMYDSTLSEVARWNFVRGWPSKVSGPNVKADSNDISLEELTVVHEYIERVT